MIFGFYVGPVQVNSIRRNLCDWFLANTTSIFTPHSREDRMIKMVSVVTAAAVLFAFSNVFAQEPVLDPPPSLTAPASDPIPAPAIEGEKKGAQQEMKEKREGKRKGKGRSKGHGKKRGLDRADEAAGDHGKQGRDNARGRGTHG
jgi:hypothetical protein